jgi:hypothetical protein
VKGSWFEIDGPSVSNCEPFAIVDTDVANDPLLRRKSGRTESQPAGRRYVFEPPLRFLLDPLAELFEFHAQTMAQRAFGPKLLEQELRLVKHLGRAG